MASLFWCPQTVGNGHALSIADKSYGLAPIILAYSVKVFPTEKTACSSLARYIHHYNRGRPGQALWN